MITKLGFTNYRSHKDTTLHLHPMTLLVGPAGGGKSNVFRGILHIQNTILRSLEEVFPPGMGEFQWIRSRWCGSTEPIGFEVHLTRLPGLPEAQEFIYSLRIADSPHGLYVLEETLQTSDGTGGSDWVFKRGRRPQTLGEFGQVDPYDPTLLNRVWHNDQHVDQQSPTMKAAHAVGHALVRFGYYHLEAGDLKALGNGQTWDRIGYRGERLPDFLAWTKSSPAGQPIYEAIRDQMRLVLPHLEEILVTQVGVDRQGLAFSLQGHQGTIAAPDLSDGTLFTLGLLAIIHGPQKPQLLCLEEPETGLHPGRIRWLFDELLSMTSAGASQTQVILTTHSPYLLDLFRDMPEAVLVIEAESGRTRARSVAGIQHQLHLDDTMGSLGQEWASGLFEGV